MTPTQAQGTREETVDMDKPISPVTDIVDTLDSLEAPYRQGYLVGLEFPSDRTNNPYDGRTKDGKAWRQGVTAGASDRRRFGLTWAASVKQETDKRRQKSLNRLTQNLQDSLDAYTNWKQADEDAFTARRGVRLRVHGRSGNVSKNVISAT